MAYKGIKLSPSVMCMDWLHLAEQLSAVERFGVDYLHFDVADSYFVPEFGLPFYLTHYIADAGDLPSDYHLMVEEPKRIYDMIPRQDGTRVSIHYEACRNLHRDLVSLRRIGFVPGLIVNPATTLSHIEYVIEEVGLVTIMTVNPGSPSQKMVRQTLAKIERLREWRDRVGYELDIVVDGNVSYENIPSMIHAGADVLVLGTSGLFVKGQSLEVSCQQLCESIDQGLTLRGGV